MLIDGRSVYIDANSFMFWRGFPITLPEIKRIEVLKGAASSVYGFDVVDGIINIIAKSPEEMKHNAGFNGHCVRSCCDMRHSRAERIVIEIFRNI